MLPDLPPTRSGLILAIFLSFLPYFIKLEFHDRYHGAQPVKKAREMAATV
jgi:hypothetical protein